MSGTDENIGIGNTYSIENDTFIIGPKMNDSIIYLKRGKIRSFMIGEIIVNCIVNENNQLLGMKKALSGKTTETPR